MIERSVYLREGHIRGAAGAVCNAHDSWTQRRSVLVELRDTSQGGRPDQVGVGEACPLPGYSPDKVDACAEALGEVAIDNLELCQARAIDSGLPAARFALETALLDLAGQQQQRAVHELLRAGSGNTLVPLQALVGDLEDARRAVARGITTLKIKVGRDADAERNLLALLRAQFPQVELRIDANGTALELEGLEELGIALCEEPGAGLPAGIGIALDESLRLMTDAQVAERCATGEIAMLLLKPTLLGGFTRCLELAAIARDHGVDVAVSHCFDGPIALAAACELALVVASTASGLTRHPGLTAFPAVHIPQLQDERVAPSGRHGLGLPTHAALSVAAADAKREAIVTAERTLCYGELKDRVESAARALVASTGPVVIDASQSLETLIQLYACLERARPAVLLHPRWSPSEKNTQAARAKDVPADAAVVVFTSGSQGEPKGVILDRDALVASADASAARLGWNQDDRWLLDLPLAHVGGLSIAIRALRARRAIVLAPTPFDPARTAVLIAEQRITLASWVPTMLTRMLQELPDWRPPAHLRAVLLGGAPASASLIARARARGVPVLPTYGMSETASQVATALPGSMALTPLPGVDLRIDDDGRIAVRTPTLMRGYLPPHDTTLGETFEHGWLLTGDRGQLDGAGKLQVHGRVDDMIVSGGENVDPVEVEAALETAPGIRAACVVGVPDPTWGQVVAALIEADLSREELDPQLTRACDGIASFKRPRRVKLVERLPLSANGKLDRVAARALLA